MKGRRPKPVELLKLEKSKLYGSQLARSENVPKAEKQLKPICPRGFTKSQRKIWNQYARTLKNYNLFTVANQTILEMLCFNKDIYDRHREKLVGMDVVIKGSKQGYDIYEKSFKVCQKVEPIIFKCLGELGLSSAGLAKIGSLAAGAINKKSKMEELLD